MLLSLIIITLFVGCSAMEKLKFSDMIKEQESQPSDRYFQDIFNNLIEKIPDLATEKYSQILFDFLGGSRSPSHLDPPFCWYVEVALDQTTIAQFECKSYWYAKDCRLKSVNGEDFGGEVQLDIHDKGQRLKINVQALYVAEYRPFVSGKLILNLVKKLTDVHPGAIATLDDVSNVKLLSLMTTGKSYYEHMGFHYVHKDGTKIIKERKNYQKFNINASIFLACIWKKLNEQMWITSGSFVIDRHLKKGILEALETQIGSEIYQLEDFWNIYRNVMKRVDFYALQEKFGFDEDLQRHAKIYCFTRFFRECLQEQIAKDIRLEFSMYEQMRYP